MSVKLHEIMSAAHARSASLAAEVAGYLVLGTADQIAGAPRQIGFSDVSLSEEGQVRIAGGTPSDDAQAERTLREMLGLMLLESSSVTPGLLRAAHKAPNAGVDSLIREIEVALVPVNRAAARRALARLHRDVERARAAGRLSAWQAPSAPPANEKTAVPVVPASPPPREVKVSTPAPPPAPSELSVSIDLPSVLARETQAPPVGEGERSWLTPDSVAVIDVEWPLQSNANADDELFTQIPVYVEELRAEEPEAPPAMPIVPDLEVPPSPEVPAVRALQAPEPVTVPQPLVAPSAHFATEPVEARDPAGQRTPVHGSSMRVLEPPPLPVLEISEPAPGVLVLAGDDATERTPSVSELPDEAAEVSAALAEVARAFLEPPEPVEGLETLDPPELVEAACESLEVAEAVEAACESLEVAEAVEADAESLELPTPAPALATVEEPSPSPLPELVSAKESLERLATLPARPARHAYAPPRYAPRKSDVEELLSGFGVANVRTERELCSDLKALAGVDQTAPPPMVELSETPPPVAVSESGDDMEVVAAGPRDSEGSSARIVAGAVSAALIVAGIGLGSIPTRDGEPTSAAAQPVLGAVQAEEVLPPCTAELTVRQIPARSRTRVRTGGDGSVVTPSRVVGSDAVFEGLACRQSAEVTVELPGRSRWVRIPVAADALSPSGEAPSLVRYTVALR